MGQSVGPSWELLTLYALAGGGGLGVCISNTFPGAAAAAGVGTAAFRWAALLHLPGTSGCQWDWMAAPWRTAGTSVPCGDEHMEALLGSARGPWMSGKEFS